MNWEAEVIRKKDSLIQDTQSFLQIESVLDEEGGTAGKPFGEKVDEALQYMLKKGQDEGFKVKNVDGYAGHIEYGEGEDFPKSLIQSSKKTLNQLKEKLEAITAEA